MADGRKDNSAEGPSGYENWLAFLRGDTHRSWVEVNLYSDTGVSGQMSCGPYQFLNALFDLHRSFSARPTMVLRIHLHVPFEVEIPDLDAGTDVSRYHGGNIPQEIAALASLDMGIRLKCGGEIRYFDKSYDSDPAGQPRSENESAVPVLLRATYGRILPLARERARISNARLSTYPKLSPQQAVALVRSARRYQDALWLAETQPELAWLLLVSALEVASTFWFSTTTLDKVEAFKAARSSLASKLEKDAPHLVEPLASELFAITKSTAKFLNFMMKFKSAEPPMRPVEVYQLSWDDAEYKKTMGIIYGHRSKALHEGIPFPEPMCGPIMNLGGTFSEIPSCGGASSYNAVWSQEDIPMQLHVFEHITRSSLLQWWDDMASANTK
jgi:hypothetical protein